MPRKLDYNKRMYNFYDRTIRLHDRNMSDNNGVCDCGKCESINRYRSERSRFSRIVKEEERKKRERDSMRPGYWLDEVIGSSVSVSEESGEVEEASGDKKAVIRPRKEETVKVEHEIDLSVEDYIIARATASRYTTSSVAAQLKVNVDALAEWESDKSEEITKKEKERMKKLVALPNDRKGEELKPSDYVDLKENGLIDQEIAEAYGVTINDIQVMKRRNDLVGKKIEKNPLTFHELDSYTFDPSTDVQDVQEEGQKEDGGKGSTYAESEGVHAEEERSKDLPESSESDEEDTADESVEEVKSADVSELSESCERNNTDLEVEGKQGEEESEEEFVCKEEVCSEWRLSREETKYLTNTLERYEREIQRLKELERVVTASSELIVNSAQEHLLQLTQNIQNANAPELVGQADEIIQVARLIKTLGGHGNG